MIDFAAPVLVPTGKVHAVNCAYIGYKFAQIVLLLATIHFFPAYSTGTYP
jgi:hypothetical protein